MGNLTPGISKGCRTLHSWPNSSGILSASTDVSVQPLSVEWVSSWVGSFICPSKTCCTHVLVLQVAVAVGQEGDPLGKKVLGLLVSASVVSASGTTGVVVTTEVDVTGTSFSFLSQTSDDIPIGLSVVLLLSLSFTVAKNCQVDAIASSLLASLVL